MTANADHVMNIGIVGGGLLCKEIIDKTSLDVRRGGLKSRIVAVSDPDAGAPGVVLAKQLGLNVVQDYHDLYDPQRGINLLIVLLTDHAVFQEILETRPPSIRVLSYHVFELFWNALGAEEKKLRERNEEIETILNGIQDNILVISPDMEIEEVNEPFLKKMINSKLGPKEAVGRKCYEVFQKRSDPCPEDEIVCPLKEVIRKKRHIRQVMTRVGMSGEVRHFEINMYPIWEKYGKISKFIEISRDITDRLKEEEEITRRLEEMVEERTRQLKETHAKLLHQDKMASLGKLAASVVHEINNPIAGILNLTLLVKRILGEREASPKEMNQIHHYLGLMETETLRISRIVSNLLAFSRQSRLELTLLDPNRIIDKTLILNANLLKIHGVKVEKRLDPHIPDILGSEDQLQQAFMNFISNAAEAMEPNKGGLIIIESKRSMKNNQWSVTFRDTGIGIPQENLPKIFEPFFTTKKDGKGVGLGLSVAYGIIQEHGGSIYVQSKPGKGTTLKVSLPLMPRPVPAARNGAHHDEH